MDRNDHYCSFFLRLKQIQTDDFRTWVVSMQDVHTGRQQFFSNVDGLIQFLDREFGNTAEKEDTSQSVTQAVQNIPPDQREGTY